MITILEQELIKIKEKLDNQEINFNSIGKELLDLYIENKDYGNVDFIVFLSGSIEFMEKKDIKQAKILINKCLECISKGVNQWKKL